MAASQIDPDSLDLILSLQLEETESFLKGKQKDGGDIPDAEAAFLLYKEELEGLLSTARDGMLSRSVGNGLLSDGAPITEHDLKPEDEVMSKLAALDIGNNQNEEGEPSNASGRGLTGTVKRHNCIACRSDFPSFDTLHCPCSHDYCRDCLAGLFEASISDESLFPPRCCGQTIPLDASKIFLPATLVSKFQSKEIEYGTPNRTYCHNVTCSRFIAPAFITKDMATCVRCSKQTCVHCKGAWHTNDCPEDTTTKNFLEFAESKGWRRCSLCGSVVELNMGCNHITCRCGAQFCYVCGVKWKNCPCDQWDEERLIIRANDIVDRDVRHAPDRHLRVEQERRNLVENHQCRHSRWRSRQGVFRCEECHHWLPEFIYECTNCRILACRRCRYNRL